MSETALQRAIIDALATIGIEAIRVHSGMARGRISRIRMARPGTPDLLIALFRQSWGEVKYGKGKLSQVQVERHAELVRSGARVAVWRSVSEALETARAWRREDAELEALVAEQRALEGVGLAP